MLSQKKKKFSYNAVVQKPFVPPSRISKTNSNVNFPDDFKSFSQSAKKQKLEEEKKCYQSAATTHPVEKRSLHTDIPKVSEPQDDFINGLMDDDFDFSEAANEIDQIEIAASQMYMKKVPQEEKENREGDAGDILEELLSGSSTGGSAGKFSLKLPKKKIPAVQNGSGPPASYQKVPDIGKQKAPSEKRKFDAMVNPAPCSTSNQQLAKNHEIEFKAKKDKEMMELLNKYKTKMEQAEQKYLSKDGEIRILRDTMRKLSDDEKRHKEKIRELEENLKTQLSEKEQKLLADVEKLKTQLRFKEKEVQDALAKQKQSLPPPSPVPKLKPKSPRAGFHSDAFEKSDKFLSLPDKSEKGTSPTKIKKVFRSKRLQCLMKDNLSQISPPPIYTETEFENAISSIKRSNFRCPHKNKKSEKPTDYVFPNNLHSVLQLVKENDVFIPQFLDQVSSCLQMFGDLISQQHHSSPVSTHVITASAKSEIDGSTTCQHCAKTYSHGLLCLKTLTLAPLSVKKHLIHGLLKHLNKEVDVDRRVESVSIGDTVSFVKYPGVSNCILVNDKKSCKPNNSVQCVSGFQSAVQFWRIFNQLDSSKYEDIAGKLFGVHVSFVSLCEKKHREAYCEYMVGQKAIAKHLTSPNIRRLTATVKILQSFIEMKSVRNLMCSNSECCALLLTYNWLFNEDVQMEGQVLFQQLVSFQSALIACNPSYAATCLLQSECRCAEEIIEFLIIYLFDELAHLQKDVFLSVSAETTVNQYRLLCFRQGMSLLYLLCNWSDVGDRISAVESTYIYLLAGTIKLFRKIPSINEKEVLDLEDLLNMNLDVPDDMMDMINDTTRDVVQS